MFFPSAPISYALEITYACNNRCPQCANVWDARRSKTLHDWKTALDTIAPPEQRGRYAELIRITGGEPTLHPDFIELIAYLDTFNISHVTFTNGRWPDPDAVLQALTRCHNFVGLLISLHGSAAAAHNLFVKGDDAVFAETCRNIQRAAEAGLLVFTNTVLTSRSCEELDDILALSRRLGAQEAVFNRYFGTAGPIKPSDAQLYRAVSRIEEWQADGVACHLGDCVPPCFVPNSSEGPNGGVEHCIISPDGFVRPENLTGYTFGNLFEQPIDAIWQSQQARRYRARIPAECLECAEVERCRGGCRSLMVEYGLERDPLMREPLQQAPVQSLSLDPDWTAIPHFTLRQEPFGYLVCRVNWALPVSFAAKPLLDALNGEPTVAELHEEFGEDGLNLVGHLYREGCLEFE